VSVLNILSGAGTQQQQQQASAGQDEDESSATASTSMAAAAADNIAFTVLSKKGNKQQVIERD